MTRIFRESFPYPFQVSSECTCMCDTRSKQSNTHTPCLPFFLFWREVRQCLSQRWASNLPVHLCLFTRMQRDAYVGEQQAAALIYKEIYTARRKEGKEIKETEQHKMAGSNADELTSYFLAIRKRPLLCGNVSRTEGKRQFCFLF